VAKHDVIPFEFYHLIAPSPLLMRNDGLSCVVLGGGGFIGTNLCRRLVETGARVRAFSRRRTFPEALPGVEFHQGDFTDAGALAAAIEGFDVVFHLVHASPPQAANLDMRQDVEKNVLPSLALLDICRRLKVKRTIFLSSGGTIYGRAKEIPTPETAPTEPITAYGVTKLAIEKYFAIHEHLHGSEYRVLRVTNPYGPFQTALKNQGVVAALVSRIISGESMEVWGDGSVVRDFIFIGDVIDALLAAVHDESTHRIFNIGSGQGQSLREIIGAVERLSGQKLDIVWKPERRMDVPVSIVSIDRARDALGWAPKTPLETGLRETIAWWRERTRAG
jgi:UDP-glucose 4-epimerase